MALVISSGLISSSNSMMMSPSGSTKYSVAASPPPAWRCAGACALPSPFRRCVKACSASLICAQAQLLDQALRLTHLQGHCMQRIYALQTSHAPASGSPAETITGALCRPTPHQPAVASSTAVN
jgi:hypothetical protein